MFVIIGAGGHAKVIIDILKANGEHIAGFYDDHPQATLEDLPLLGMIKDITNDHPEYRYIIAIGNNEIRRKIAAQMRNNGCEFGTAIHPSAIIGSEVIIGEGTVIMPNCVINHSSSVGTHTIINTAATVDHDCTIKDFVHISPGSHLAGNVTVGEGTHIGIGSSIIQSITIGTGSIIGAGAAVVNNTPDYTVAVGCPAKVIKRIK
jgi:acetyltransferase EpsM